MFFVAHIKVFERLLPGFTLAAHRRKGNQIIGAEPVNLGFGCFHFNVRNPSPPGLTGGDYLDEVRAAIDRLPEAEQLTIYPDDEFVEERIVFPAGDASPPLRRGGYAVPNIGFTEIVLVLRIHSELQGELLERSGSIYDPLSGERFLICLRHGWAMPHAMIWAMDAKAGYAGSEAVKLTREYLDLALGADSGLVGFDFLGPSPAHVNVVLNPRSPISADPASRFLLQSYTRPAYHLYELAYEPSDFSSPEAVAMRYFDEVGSPLDLYYRCEMARAREIFEWQDLLGRVESIKTAFRQSGLRGALGRLGRQRGPINDAAIALADLELEQLLARQELTTSLNSCYDPGRPAHLKQLAATSVAEFTPYPTEQITRLLSLFEQQRLLGRDVLAAGLVALLAAAVGAAATLLASA